MRYLKQDQAHQDADSSDDTASPVEYLEQQLDELRTKQSELNANDNALILADLLLKSASILVDLEKGRDAYFDARQAFDLFVEAENWEQAVYSCDIMFLSEQPESLAALGQGVWLGVTFPIEAELTIELLRHIIEETPNDSDGGAVAAAVAHYIADIRTKDKQRNELMLFTNNLLANVARRHSDVQDQAQFDYWFEKLELNDPNKFLVRLRNIIDVLVQDDWWIDQEVIRESLPPQ